MSVRRFVGTLLLVAATSVGLVAPASADPYGPKPGSLRVSQTVVTQGERVTASGDGFCAYAGVRVSLTAGRTESTYRIGADSRGVATTRLRLTKLGTNVIEMRGCWEGGGRQTLAAKVRVLPHQARGEVSRSTVHKGGKVTISARGFCRRTPVMARVFDDGVEYLDIKLRSNRHGRVTTTVRLNRVGTARITLQGCRARGGTQAYSDTVTVRRPARSFSSAPAALVHGAASRLTPVGAGALGLLLVAVLGLLLFAGLGLHLVRGLRRRATR